jgi:hypothetical protein
MARHEQVGGSILTVWEQHVRVLRLAGECDGAERVNRKQGGDKEVVSTFGRRAQGDKSQPCGRPLPLCKSGGRQHGAKSSHARESDRRRTVDINSGRQPRCRRR